MAFLTCPPVGFFNVKHYGLITVNSLQIASSAPSVGGGAGSGGIIFLGIVIVLILVAVLVDLVLFKTKKIGVTAILIKKFGTASEKDKEAMLEEGKLG